MDEELNLIWTVTKDGYGNDDMGNSLALDGSNNILLTGYMTNDNGKKELCLLKYNNSGTLQWEKKRASAFQGDAQGWKVAERSGRISVVGDYTTNLGTDIISLMYDSNGNEKWLKTFDGGSGEDDSGRHAELTGSDILYASGITKENGVKKYVDIKYQEWERPMIGMQNGGGELSYVKGEVIVKFNPDVVIQSAVNDKGKIFGTLADFVTQAAIDSVNIVLGVDMKYQKTVKIFKRLTVADSLSTTRLGDVIRLPDHWSTFVVMLPANMNENTATDSLESFETGVWYACKNNIRTRDDIPNDEVLQAGEQESLIGSSEYPDAHINMDGAWDIENGRSEIRVGVMDDPIYWQHEDFGFGSIAGTNVKGGYDYWNNVDIYDTPGPYDSHGTQCAGIIGALRYNTLGIAGIAGGDCSVPDAGISLYSFGVFDDGDWVGDDIYANAIVEASIETEGIDYACHILNNSLSGPDVNLLIKEAVETCNRNICTFVAARGNNGNSVARYPACFEDEYVFSIGGSGDDGARKASLNGNDAFETSYGVLMDVIAPGASELIATTVAPAEPESVPGCSATVTDYSCFSGTSAAAPHAAGVAALMLSHHNFLNTSNDYPNNLAPEDVEFLIQKYAYDIEGIYSDGTYSVGYDDYNGWGRINAANVLEKVDMPAYRVEHEFWNGAEGEIWGDNANLQEEVYGVPPGDYIASVKHWHFPVSYTYGPNDLILDWWIRASSSHGLTGENDAIFDHPWFEVYNVEIDGNSFSADIWTYQYALQTNLGWVELPPDNLFGVALSFHIVDQTMIGVDEINESKNTFSVYPNPASDELNLNLHASSVDNATARIYDSTGRLVFQQDYGTLNNSSKRMIDIRQLSVGTYCCTLQLDGRIETSTFIISR